MELSSQVCVKAERPKYFQRKCIKKRKNYFMKIKTAKNNDSLREIFIVNIGSIKSKMESLWRLLSIVFLD